MVEKENVTFVDISGVYDHIGFTNDEVEAIADYGFGSVSYGDAYATLISGKFALSCIINGYASYRDELNGTTYTDEDRPNNPNIFTEEDIANKFWEVVGKDEFINLEF